MAENNEAVTGNASGSGPQIALQRIYIKDMSFESPQAPKVFLEQGNPQVKLDIASGARKIEDDIYEVVLTVTATAVRAEETVYLVEIQQAGAFTLAGIEGSDLEKALTIFCPNVLFPYLRESVDGLLIKGGFPPLHLAPMNFEAIYAQAKLRQQQGGGIQPQQAAEPSAEGEPSAEQEPSAEGEPSAAEQPSADGQSEDPKS